MTIISTQAQFAALATSTIVDSTFTFSPSIGSNNPAYPFPPVKLVEFKRCIFEKQVVVNFQEFDKIRFNDCKVSSVKMVDGGFAKALIFDNAEPSNHRFSLIWQFGAGCDELRFDGYRNIAEIQLQEKACKTLRLSDSKVNFILLPKGNTQLEDIRLINSEVAHIVFD